jgi:hypothetical protein
MFREFSAYRSRPGELPLADLESELRSGTERAHSIGRYLDGIERFAFTPNLQQELLRSGKSLFELARSGPLRPILDALLDQAGLNYEERPKGLIEFHRYDTGARTAFDEHLVEAALISKDRYGRCRIHFTVSQSHRAQFEAIVDRLDERRLPTGGVLFEIEFSGQDPATDTMALRSEGSLLRGDDGAPVFRPGGHGSLLRNLQALRAEVILVKNIDNVTVDRFRQPTITYSRLLGGLLLKLQNRSHQLLRRLRDEADRTAVADAIDFARKDLGLDPPRGCTREAAVTLLDRPLRVCGMVPNEGEPGGGPFWVRERDGGASRQIVERAHLDPSSKSQLGIFEKGTHFNPVFMALGFHDERGQTYDLEAFVDPETYLISTKTAVGMEIRVLEWPGLWNGAMARWNTVFAEVPIEVFNPVKTVIDLLREKHQPA